MFERVKDKALDVKVGLDSAVVGTMIAASQVGIAFADGEEATATGVFSTIEDASNSIHGQVIAIARPVAIMCAVICFGLSMVSFFDAKLTKIFRGAGFSCAGAYLLMKLVPAIFDYADTLIG